MVGAGGSNVDRPDRAGGWIGGQIPIVPQMALKSWCLLATRVPKVPQIAESAPGKAFRPQIRAVHAGIARRTSACSTPELTIELISDEC
jgi:hypothetical protein